MGGNFSLPGLPGDEEEAVVRGVDPVGAALSDHNASASASPAAAAPVVLSKTSSITVSDYQPYWAA